MKLVREHIYEAFKEESDPIRDMNIGLYAHRDFVNVDKFLDYLITIIPQLLKTSKIPDDILRYGGAINHTYFLIIQKFLTEYISFEGISTGEQACRVYYWPELLMERFKKMGFER